MDRIKSTRPGSGFSEQHQLLSYAPPLKSSIYSDDIQAEPVNSLAKHEDTCEFLINERQVDGMIGDDIVVVAQHRLGRLANALDVVSEGVCNAAGDIPCISMIGRSNA